MTTARVFMSGNGQAVRLPKDFCFDGSEVEIFRSGDQVILQEIRPPATSLAAAFDPLTQVPDDFEVPDDPSPQERDFGDD